MTNALVQVTLPNVDGIPEDAFSNSFAFQLGHDITPANMGELTIGIANFYNQAHAALGFDIASRIAAGVSRAAGVCTMDVYDVSGHLDGSPHGSPIATDTFTLDPVGASTGMPEEIAAVITLRATGWQTALIEVPDDDAPPDAKVDRPRQRLSGRLYIGPLTIATVVHDGVGRARVDTDFISNLIGGIYDLQTHVEGFGHELAVWSRKDASMRTVTHAQADNAFDVQRRRGGDPTFRNTLAMP